MFDLFGADLPLPVKFVGAFIFVLALIVAATWLVRRFGGTRLGATSARGRQPRLAVIDAASVDARRRLVLIRRDNVEHLVLIGGPTDIVVEQNIVRAVPVAAPREAPPARPYNEGTPREAATRQPEPRQPEPRQPEPRSIEPSWTAQPEPVARSPRPAEPAWAPEPPARPARTAEPPAWTPQDPTARPARPAEPAWTQQTEPAARQSRPADPKPAPAVDLPQRPLPEPVTAALRAASAPEAPRAAARPSAPRAPAPPPPPLPAPAPAATEPELPVEVRQSPPTADVNLADMAQRLEAALRRPARPAEVRAPVARAEPRPQREAFRPAPAPAAAPPVAPVSEPQRPAAPEMPRAATIPEPTAAPAVEPPKPTEAAAEPKAAPRSVFDSLEEEMANLLGKPAGKP